MSNPYRQMKKIAEKHGLNLEDVIHALMGTVYPNCCDHCSQKLQSGEFMEAFARMAEEFEFCKTIANRDAA